LNEEISKIIEKQSYKIEISALKEKKDGKVFKIVDIPKIFNYY
jgi:hypothetical protein